MNKLPFISIAIDEHVGDTLLLSLEEDACYTRLIMQAWRNGGYLPNDNQALANAARIPVEKWMTIRPAVEVLFEVGKRGWFQQRMLDRIAEISDKIDKRKAAGKAGGKASALKAKANRNSNRSTDATTNYNYNHNLNLKQKEEPSSYIGVPNPARTRAREEPPVPEQPVNPVKGPNVPMEHSDVGLSKSAKAHLEMLATRRREEARREGLATQCTHEAPPMLMRESGC